MPLYHPQKIKIKNKIKKRKEKKNASIPIHHNIYESLSNHPIHTLLELLY